ncbi:MAG TPA: hypothetical protein DDX39_04365 [Bacteroidales bacterium]|nr:MAG: hypothetical protein A2W98_10635 [Bacteroidetes bacterium GWF2_33_38]OFY75494.1 MAG: hypothetical protein A2265_03400 [Bacteroidetes bacterium RIFOXYA12_FULL_33_9]OFY85460.1 MAG: hypothetical protein A2236_11600 [Bacteroidetes bacterium RIFOXYA2_FULL_33_7]HBF87857.1 hypothetical protein [Bacteroidales bacterium]
MELSIIICSYNRDKYLPEALESLTKQTLDNSKVEYIVINNNSTDKTEEISLNFGKNNPELNFKYAIESNQGLSYARNKGIEIASGKIIAFIDDDAIAEPDYAENLLQAFQNNPKFDSLGGKVLPIYFAGKEPKWMSKYLEGFVSKVDYGDTTTAFVSTKYPVGCNMAFRKEVFEELGGFNVDLGIRNDDKYMFLKLRRNGKTILYAADVIVHHYMDAFRVEDWYIKKQSFQVGATERIRLKQEPFIQTLAKPFEYLFKFAAAVILGTVFLLKGQTAKATYLVWIRWLVFIGFFKRKY